MEKLKTFWNKTNRWHRLGIVFIIAESRILPSRQYGFTCNDPDLSHTFNGDTIDMKCLFSAVLLLPILVLLLAEKILSTVKGHQWRQQALYWYKQYLFGLLLNMTLTAIVKNFIGMPRPHFFDTCSPEEAGTCEGSEFVARYACTKSSWLSQSDRSFPSGHSALGVHTGIFLALYLRRRFPASAPAAACELLFVLLACACAASRVWDRRHHAQDALAGAALALPVLAYTVDRSSAHKRAEHVLRAKDSRLQGVHARETGIVHRLDIVRQVITLCKNFETNPQFEDSTKGINGKSKN